MQTETPKYNPLEKLPILLFSDGTPPVYESWLIQEYITQKYKEQGPSLLPESLDEQLLARQIQVICDGACDAMVCFSWPNIIPTASVYESNAGTDLIRV